MLEVTECSGFWFLTRHGRVHLDVKLTKSSSIQVVYLNLCVCGHFDFADERALQGELRAQAANCAGMRRIKQNNGEQKVVSKANRGHVAQRLEISSYLVRMPSCSN